MRGDEQRQDRRHADRDDEVGAVAQLAHESAAQQRAQLRPLVVPANRHRAFLRAAPAATAAAGSRAQRNLLDVLDQPERLVLVAPEFRRITAGRDELAAIVFLVDDVAAEVAQRRLQHVKNEFRPRRSAGRARAQFGAELMLMLRFGEVAQHVRRRAEKDEPPAFVEQDRLVKHLEKSSSSAGGS